jgi:hypothetical protein
MSNRSAHGTGTLMGDPIEIDALSRSFRLFTKQKQFCAIGVADAFDQAGWGREKEFKGRYLFSSSKGDTQVGVDARIELVKTIVQGTTATKNARAMFCLAFNYEGRTEANYLVLLWQKN